MQVCGAPMDFAASYFLSARPHKRVARYRVEISFAAMLPAIRTLFLSALVSILLSGCKPGSGGNRKLKSSEITTEQLVSLLDIKAWEVTVPESYGADAVLLTETFDAEGKSNGYSSSELHPGSIWVAYREVGNQYLLTHKLGEGGGGRSSAVLPSIVDSAASSSSDDIMMGDGEMILFSKKHFKRGANGSTALSGKDAVVEGTFVVRICAKSKITSRDLIRRLYTEN